MPLISTGFHLPYSSHLTQFARALRNEMTPAEKRLWYEYLRKAPLRFRRQRPIGNFIVDFYCAKRKLAIEVDGETHLAECQRQADAQRTAALEQYGLRVLRFSNDEVFDHLELVIVRIENELRCGEQGGSVGHPME